MTLEKWLPQEDTAVQEYLRNCKKLSRLARELEENLIKMLCDFGNVWQGLESVSLGVGSTAKLFARVTGDHRPTIVSNNKCLHWRRKMNMSRLSILHLLNLVVTAALEKYLNSSEHLILILRFVVFFDQLIPMAHDAKQCKEIVKNSCPTFLFPMRKLSITKILQIIAQQQAEECGKQMAYILINIKNETERLELSAEEDYPASDNSSMEVYRTLTENLSPAHMGKVQPPSQADKSERPQMIVSEVSLLESLIASEGYKLSVLLDTMAKETPDRLGPHAIKESKSSGEMRINSRAKHKILSYYQEILWGMVGQHAEFALIWKGIGHDGEICKEWTTWLKNFTANVSFPSVLRPALQSLIDGLCVHVTSVVWDDMFRKALVAAAHQHSRHINHDFEMGTHTGHLFSDMLSELVQLSNSCEGSNWTVAALEELPLTEQIPILHRLDHTVHTARLWAEGKARLLANSWNMDQFFRVTQSDVASCLHALTTRHFANQNDLLGDECSVHVMVCGKMRAKLTSEVNANIEKLQAVPSLSIKVLSSVCRTYSLANLKLMFPEPSFWRQNLDDVPQYASNYVEDYLDIVLKPVLQATKEMETSQKQNICCLVLDIMCEAWLDHIYKNRVKFSEWGALQLLADFGSVPTWLMERSDATPNLMCTEMLRRCEGVGRLLLSQPGHRIPMVDKTIRTYQGEAESSPTRMPPEMYVPNQSQWLELRAAKSNYFSLCCASLLKTS